MSIKINEKVIELDEDGFLKNSDQWEPAVTEAMAAKDGFVLTELHWEVIIFMRGYYKKYQISPDLRVISKGMAHALGTGKRGKEQLTELFSGSPAKTACRYAGLPTPVSSACV